jgi:DNA primase
MRREDLDAIKSAVDLRELVGRTIPLKASGDKMVSRCPFHVDKDPSFAVWRDHFHCFGCGTSGDVFTWVMTQESVTFPQAAESLRKTYGLVFDRPREAPPPSTEPVREEEAPKRVTSAVTVGYWIGHPRAVRYFRSRGLSDVTIAKFKLGYDGRRFVIPTFVENRLLHVSLRVDPENEWDRGPKYLCVKNSKRSVFNSDAIGRGDKVYIAEGQIDCMLLDQLGYSAITSTAGAKSFSPEWFPLLAGKHVVIIYDHDPNFTGFKAGTRLGIDLLESGFPASVVIHPLTLGKLGVKDVGEYVQSRRLGSYSSGGGDSSVEHAGVPERQPQDEGAGVLSR